MKTLTTLFFISIISLAFAKNDEYRTYCNDRFDFCIKYPTRFHLQEKSLNGDGAFFEAIDKKAEIWAYGSLAVEGLDQLEQEFNIASGKINVTYKVKKDNWFVLSGVDDKGNFIYQKTMKKNIDYYGDKGTPVFQTLRLSYPPNQKAQYETYCAVIAKSF